MPADTPRTLLIEPSTRQDLSLRWKIADAFYEHSGPQAWTSGLVPSRATSSYPAARQNALLATRLFVEARRQGHHQDGEPFYVLELGGGSGRFAQNFLRALNEGCGGAGRELLRCIRYLFSDRTETQVRQILATPGLRELSTRGQIIAATCDMRRPDELTLLDGARLEKKIALVIANYVVCVLPPSVLRLEGGRWLEQYLSLTYESDRAEETRDSVVDGYFAAPAESRLLKALIFETEWREVNLDTRFSDSLHARTIRALLTPLGDATVAYPYFFVDLCRAFSSRLAPGGLIVVSDYGECEREDMAGVETMRAQRYGNSPSHRVNFALFDALAAEAGWSVMRSHNPLGHVHVAALCFEARIAGSVQKRFEKTFLEKQRGEDLLDFRDAAHHFYEAEKYALAARLYRRCVQLDPGGLDDLFWFGRSAHEAEYYRVAYRAFHRGLKLDPDTQLDFEFYLGRTCRALGLLDEAVSHYQASLRKQDHAVTHVNLARIHLSRGDSEDAERHIHSALALDAENDRARKMLAELGQG